MTPSDFLQSIINPALVVLGPKLASDEARVMMLAIALQETRLRDRRQVADDGRYLGQYGRGWWQFERKGGVAAVMESPATSAAMRGVCELLTVPFDDASVHEAIAWNDRLAAIAARLFLYQDPSPLPALGDQQAAWASYLRIWAPGKPRPDDWPANYKLALAAVSGAAATVPLGGPAIAPPTSLAAQRSAAAIVPAPVTRATPEPVIIDATPAAAVKPLPAMVTKNGFKTSAFVSAVAGVALVLAPALLPWLDAQQASATERGGMIFLAYTLVRSAVQMVVAWSATRPVTKVIAPS